MKKPSKNFYYILMISIILGVFIAVQYKIVQTNYLQGASPIKKDQELSSSFTTIINERDSLKQQIDELESQIKEIEDSASQENALVKRLTEEVTKYKLLGGFADAIGQGIEIQIDNPSTEVGSNFDVNIVNDFDMINTLINELNAAGAEAISINDERIIATTEIRNAGNNISINTIPYKPPFIVKAIGDKNTLEGALNQLFGIASAFRDRGYYFEIRKSDNIEVLKYNGVVKNSYLSPKETK